MFNANTQLPQLSHGQNTQGLPVWLMYASYQQDPNESNGDNDYTLKAEIRWSWEDGGRTGIRWFVFNHGSEIQILKDDDYDESAQAVEDHEGVDVLTQWQEDHLSMKQARLIGRWPFLKDMMENVERRWDALRLLVSPSVTM